MRQNSFLKLKMFIAGMICSPFIGKLIGNIFRDRIPLKGLIICTHNPAISPVTKAQLFWGIYESAELKFICKYLRTDLAVIELGSSLGVTTCSIRNLIQDTKTMICVEANPMLMKSIRQNLDFNCPGKKITLLNGAIHYSDEGPAKLILNEKSTDSVIAGSEGSGGISVPAIRLSDIIEAGKLAEFALVSDIEGAEIQLLTEDSKALERCRQIIIELHSGIYKGDSYNPSSLCDMIMNHHGFRLTDQFGPVFVFERKNGLS